MNIPEWNWILFCLDLIRTLFNWNHLNDARCTSFVNNTRVPKPINVKMWKMANIREIEEQVFVTPSTIRIKHFKVLKALGCYKLPEVRPRIFIFLNILIFDGVWHHTKLTFKNFLPYVKPVTNIYRTYRPRHFKLVLLVLLCMNF